MRLCNRGELQPVVDGTTVIGDRYCGRSGFPADTVIGEGLSAGRHQRSVHGPLDFISSRSPNRMRDLVI